jgi:hypothetical protein
MRRHPPEVSAEVDRLAKICRDDQDVIVSGPDENGRLRVYLQDSAPLVKEPQIWAEEITFLKHLVRSGKVDMKRLVTERDGEAMSHEEFFRDYCDLY